MKKALFVVSFMAIFVAVTSCKKAGEEKITPTGKKDVQVQFFSPRGEVGRPHDIVVSFSAPMVAVTTIGKLEGQGPLAISPMVAGTFHWLGTHTVSFVPEKPFPFATKFLVSVTPDVLSAEGSGLAAPVSWGFETARPLLVSSYPKDGDDEVALGENILLLFNQPMDPAVVGAHLKIVTSTAEADAVEIKASVRWPTAEEWKDKEGNIEYAVIVMPLKKFPISATVEARLDAGLTGREGPITAGKEQVVGFNTYAPLKVEGLECSSMCDPDSPIQVMFNNKVVTKDAMKFISVTPKVEFEEGESWETSTVWLYGSFMPNTTYEVMVLPELTDVHGNRLGSPQKLTYTTSHRSPSLGMVSGFGVIEVGGPLGFAVTTTNVERFDAKFRRLPKDEIIPLLGKGVHINYRARDGDFTPTYEEGIKPAGETDKSVVTQVMLNKALGETKKGVLLVDVTSPNIYNQYYEDEGRRLRHFRTVLQVTDFGLTGKFSDKGLLVWVSSLAKGEPIEGVRVEVRRKDNGVLWTGTTDREGVAKTDVVRPKGEYGPEELYVFVEKDGDFAFTSSEWREGFYPWDFGIMGSYGDEDARAFLFTERGIYKPGETIHLKAILRGFTDRGITTTKGEKGTIEATDRRGKNYYTSQVEFSEFGTASADIEIPSYAATGYSEITLKVPRGPGRGERRFDTSVNIAVYKPAGFKLETTPASKDVIAGGTIKVDVKADYLFGEPMKKGEAEWSVYRRRSFFRPGGFDDYAFGTTYTDEEEDEDEEYGSFEVEGKQSGKLGERGEIQIAIPTKGSPIPNTTDYEVEATVTDINKTTLSGRAVVKVHPGEFYIGLYSTRYIMSVGEPLGVKLVSVDVGGKPVTGRQVKAVFFKREWHSVKKKAVVGYTYDSEPVDTEVGSCNVVTAAAPVKCEFAAQTSGFHYVMATSSDSKGNPVASSTPLYVTGLGEAGWRPETHDRIELVSDKKGYAPGEVAKVLVKSPFDSAYALITYERDGIIHREVKTLAGYAPMIEVPIAETYVPNVFLSVVLVKGRTSDEVTESGDDVGRPRAKVGYINIPVSPASKKLRVTVGVDKREASPGEEVEISMKVGDSAGTPVRAELAVMAVDVGSLILTDYKTPDPFSEFYREVGLGVATVDSRMHVVGRRHYGEKGEAEGGGGAALEALRSKFVPVAYWNPSVVTDESGVAKVRFKLPDNLTTFKIMAVADTADMFGSGDAEIISRKPFMIRTALPYFVTPGDSFKSGVVIHNYTDHELAGSVEAKAFGIELVGDNSQNFKIEPKEKAEVFFTLLAKQVGTARLAFRASTDAASDGIEVPLEIKITHPKEVFATFGETEKLTKEFLEPLEDVYPDVGGLDVGISSTALVGLGDASLYLINYPYECLEQKISRAMGMMLSSKIATMYAVKDVKPDEYESKIKNVLGGLYEFQAWDGGFSFWGGMASDPYLSIYAVQFMVMADGMGYKQDVDDMALENGKQYLKEMLRWDAEGKGYNQAYLDSLKAYAVYVLSLAGDPEMPYHESLYARRDTLSFATRAQLMMAIKKEGGTDSQFSDFVQFVDNHLAVTPAHAHVDEGKDRIFALQSDDYANAYALMALLKIKPDHPFIPKIAAYLLSSSKKGYWDSTHPTAAVLASLLDYIAVHERAEPDFRAVVKLGGEELLSAKFEGREVKQEGVAVPISKIMGLKGRQEMSFAKEGAGRLYYHTRLTYASTESPLPPLEEGFTIYKSIGQYDEGKEGDGFKRGDVAKVHLEFVLPEPRRYIVIDDGLPAGLEAINYSLETAQHHLFAGMDCDDCRRLNHVEAYGDRFLVFADMLPAGSYSFDYLARVATKGSFSVPPARIEEMYNPEVFGRSASGRIEIE